MLLLIMLTGLLANIGATKQSTTTGPSEQTSFIGLMIQRPVKPPESVIQFLKENPQILTTSLGKPVSEPFAADWFSASVIHLGASDGADLIVIGKGPLLGPSGALFLLFRKTVAGYQLIFHERAQFFELVDSSSNDLRDISIMPETEGPVLSLIYRFNGQDYQLPKEQISFSTEDEGVQRPASLPEDVLNILRSDKRVSICEQNESIAPSQVPGDWFTGSEIHLAGPNETDLVVRPGTPSSWKPGTGVPSPNRCLFGANTIQFWVFSEASHAKLLLSVGAHDLTVLDTRGRDYRDVEAVVGSLRGVYTTVFRFDGERYQSYRRNYTPTGSN
ncbi:MAG TPA: hypothetical protein VKB26_09730 [Candidatus Acidoferrales bacterium]|nr:hypothetical protein [Candidatus Acidoferrales bacterium]